MKTPSLTIYLSSQSSEDSEVGKSLRRELEYTTLGHITKKTEIFYDKDPRNTVVEADKGEDGDYIQNYINSQSNFDINELSPWLLRIQLAKELMPDISIDLVVKRLSEEFGKHLFIMSTDFNSQNLVIRINIKKDEKDSEEDEKA